MRMNIMNQENKFIIINKIGIENIILQHYNLNRMDVVNINLNNENCIIEFLDKEQFPNHYLNRKTMHYLPYNKDWYLEWINLDFPATTYNLFKALDIPFIREEYYRTIKSVMKKTGTYDIKQLNKKSVIGKYVSKMYLHDFLLYNFENTFRWEQKDYCPPIESIKITWKNGKIDIDIV